MKVIEVLLYASLLSAATAQATKPQRDAQYNAICSGPSGPVQQEEISPGYTVRYTCDMIGDYDLSTKTTSTLKGCAERCQALSGCTSSTWNKAKGECMVSGPSAGFARVGSVLMEKVDDDPFPDEEEEEEEEDPFPEECEDELAQCKQDLAAAAGSGSGSGSSSGSSSGFGSSGPDRFSNKCPGDNNIYTIQGRKWKALCGKNRGANFVQIGGITYPMTTGECIERCANTPDCNLATSTVTGGCYALKGSGDLYSQNNYNAYLEV